MCGHAARKIRVYTLVRAALVSVCLCPGQANAWEWRPTEDYSDRELRSLKSIREEAGRDCAMIYYIEAWRWAGRGKRSDRGHHGDGYSTEFVRHALDGKEWPEEQTWLVNALDAMELFIEMITAGAAIDEATFTTMGGTVAIEPYYPHAMQHAASWVILRGFRSESHGQPEAAMDDYLTALKLGRDLCTSGTWENALGNGQIIQLDALNCLDRMIDSQRLDSDMLKRLADRIHWIEERQVYRPDEKHLMGSYHLVPKGDLLQTRLELARTKALLAVNRKNAP
jgi:hypothetical protein